MLRVRSCFSLQGSQTYFRRRLSWTTHSTSSHLQLPHGAPSTTSQRTLRARHDTQARAARRFVILPSAAIDARFLGDDDVSPTDGGAGGGDMEPVGADDDRGEGVSPFSDMVSRDWQAGLHVVVVVRGKRPKPRE